MLGGAFKIWCGKPRPEALAGWLRLLLKDSWGADFHPSEIGMAAFPRLASRSKQIFNMAVHKGGSHFFTRLAEGEREEEKGGGSDWVPDLELSMCTQEQDRCDGSE